MRSYVVSAVCLALFVGCHTRQPVIEHMPERASASEPTAAPASGPCPENTVLVEGDYCPNAREVCLQWVDVDGKATPEAIPTSGDSSRCGTWKFPTECLSKEKVHKRFCIDKFEYPNVEGQKPESWMSYYDVKRACEAQGKRLCEKSEWTFACEGPDMHPYPYGDGYHRDKTACNIDNHVPKDIKNVLKVTRRDSPDGKVLDGLLVPAGSNPKCVSAFGVHDMVGNIDEFVHDPNGHPSHGDPNDHGPFISGLVSGHVFGVRNACRPMTSAHNEYFAWYETGGRCCSDPKR